MPQSDHICSLIFNVYMDPLLERLNTFQGSVESCFADDIILLTSDSPGHQHLLSQCAKWARMTERAQNAARYESMAEGMFQIQQEIIRQVEKVTYLGLTLGRTGAKDAMMIQRVKKKQKALMLLRIVAKVWNLRLRQRRRLCQTFVFSKVYFVTYLRPLSGLLPEMK